MIDSVATHVAVFSVKSLCKLRLQALILLTYLIELLTHERGLMGLKLALGGRLDLGLPVLASTVVLAAHVIGRTHDVSL